MSFIAVVPAIVFGLFGLALEPAVGPLIWEPFDSMPGDIYLPLAKTAAIPVIVSILLLANASFECRLRSRAAKCGIPIDTLRVDWAQCQCLSTASYWIVDLRNAAKTFALRIRIIASTANNLLIAFPHLITKLTPAGLSGASPLLN